MSEIKIDDEKYQQALELISSSLMKERDASFDSYEMHLNNLNQFFRCPLSSVSVSSISELTNKESFHPPTDFLADLGKNLFGGKEINEEDKTSFANIMSNYSSLNSQRSHPPRFKKSISKIKEIKLM